MLADLEKVIRGLECWLNDDTHCPDDNCPYMKRLVCDQAAILHDALSLLQAQAPRVMNAEELRQYLMVNENGLLSRDQWQELGQRAPLYIEFRRPDEYQVNWRTAEHLRPWAMEPIFWDSYGKYRRCWTSRPTDEQREAAPWEN